MVKYSYADIQEHIAEGARIIMIVLFILQLLVLILARKSVIICQEVWLHHIIPCRKHIQYVSLITMANG